MVSESRVRHLLSSVLKNEERFVDHERSYNGDPLIKLLRMLHHFPYSWRKWILNICRIQENPLENLHLRVEDVTPSSISYSIHDSQFTITTHDVADLIVNILPAGLSLSLLSYFTRAESTAFPDQFREQRQIRINKEIGAALSYDPSRIQRKDYTDRVQEGS